MAAVAPPAPDPEPWIALIDENRVLVGYDETGTKPGVRVPENCDLRIGEYRHNEQLGRWEPLALLLPKLPDGGEPPVRTSRAVADGLEALFRHTRAPMPETVRDYIAWAKARPQRARRRRARG